MFFILWYGNIYSVIMEVFKYEKSSYWFITIENWFAFYSADLVDALLLYPYTKIAHFSQQLGISRQTAASYLRQLEDSGIVKSKQIWKTKFYINTELFNALVPASYEVPDTKIMIVTESPANIYSKSKN